MPRRPIATAIHPITTRPRGEPSGAGRRSSRHAASPSATGSIITPEPIRVRSAIVRS
jgi:hypothetical protein